MTIKNIVAASLTALAIASAAPAAATILLGTQTGNTAGTFTLLNAAGLTIPTSNSFNVFGLNEKQNLAALGNIGVNVGTAVTTGQILSSHYIFFNPAGMGVSNATGTVTFNQRIVGIQSGQGLIKSASAASVAYRAAGTTYNYASIANAGLEAGGGDFVTITTPYTLTYNFNANVNGFDSVRVFTAVPEASVWAMFIAGFGLVGLGLRRRNSFAVRAA